MRTRGGDEPGSDGLCPAHAEGGPTLVGADRGPAAVFARLWKGQWRASVRFGAGDGRSSARPARGDPAKPGAHYGGITAAGAGGTVADAAIIAQPAIQRAQVSAAGGIAANQGCKPASTREQVGNQHTG